MFGSEILDVAIGMAFIFLLLSLVASAMREGVESFFKARAVHLEQGVRDFVDDADGSLVKSLYNHPLIYSLFPGRYSQSGWGPAGKEGTGRMRGRNLPTNIPAPTLAKALLDVVSRGPVDHPLSVYDASAPQLNVERLRAALPFISSTRLSRMLALAMDGAADMATVEGRIATWFDDSMDQVSAMYRRHTQWWLLVISFLTVVMINANAVDLVNHLSRNKASREALVARAQGYVERAEAVRDSIRKARADSPGAPAENATIDSLFARALDRAPKDELASLKLPLGWPSGFWSGLASMTLWQWVGLLISTFAITLGAPFWFDALRRLTALKKLTESVQQAVGDATQKAVSKEQPASPAGAGAAAAAVLPAVGGAAAGAALPAGAGAAQGVAASAGAATGAAAQPVDASHQWSTGNPNEGII